MNIHYINENQIMIDDDETTSIGKEIDFPNTDGSLLISAHGDPSIIDETIIDNLEQQAMDIAQNYDEFKSQLADFICSHSEEGLDPEEVFNSLDLIQISSNEDLSILCYTCSFEELMLNIYYDAEEGQLVNLEVIDGDDNGEDEI